MKRLARTGLGLSLALTLLGLVWWRAMPTANAVTNNTINFQARLQTAAGSIVQDGYYNVEFKLYSAASGGTAEWTEDYTYNSGSGSCSGPLGGSDCRIRVVDGYLTANLGSISSFPSTISWDQQQWLTMNIGGTVTSGTFPTIGDGEMNPRIQLTGVPYAFKAGSAFNIQNASGTNLLSTSGNQVTLQNATSSSAALTFGGDNSADLYRSVAGTLKTDGTLDAAVALQTNDVTRIDSSGNLTNIGNITLANPGIGNPSTITFTKTSDHAWISVEEVTNDATTYGFYMSDNPDSSSDQFLWQINDWKGAGGSWQPLEFSNIDANIRGANINAYGDLNVHGPWYSGIDGTPNTVYTSQTGTLNLTPGVSGYTGTYGFYWVKIDGSGTPNTFSWGYNTSGSTGAASGTNVPITGSAQTLNNGVTVTFSGTIGGVVGDLYEFRVYKGGDITTDGNLDVNGNSINLGGTSTAADSVITVQSQGNAGLVLQGDTDNDPSEVGSAYVQFGQDATANVAVIGTVQNAGASPQGGTYTGTSINAVLLGSVGAEPLQFGTNGTVRMTVSTSGQVGIGATPANGLLTIGTNTTTATGGLYFGTDTNLYRGAANTLQTDDKVVLNGGSQSLQIGTTGCNNLYIGNTTDGIIRCNNQFQFVTTQTQGFNFSGGNLGIGITNPQAALALGSDAGTATSGIKFGSTGDTNLYRSVAGVLKTDNNLTVVGNITATSTIGFSNTGNANQGINLNMVVSNAVSANQVVVIDTANAGQVVKSSTGGATGVFGVTTSTQNAGIAQPIVISGIYQVMADTGAVNVGDYLVTSSITAGDVASSADPAAGTVLGQAMSAKVSGSAGLVWVYINPGYGGGGSTSTMVNYNSYGLMESDFVDNSPVTLPGKMFEEKTVTIGDYIYLFGGNNGSADTGVIYKAPVSNPTNWTDTGVTLPGTPAFASIAVIGSYVYIFGGGTNSPTSNIYRAPVSDPVNGWLNMSLAANGSHTLPGSLRSSSLAIINNYVYLFGGFNGSSNTNKIYKASVADPLTWTDTGAVIPGNISDANIAVIGSYVYLFGGGVTGPDNKIYRAPVSNPTNWPATVAGTLPNNQLAGHLAIIGNYVYIIGGSNGAGSANFINRAPIGNPTNGWSNTGSTIPGNLAGGASAIVGNAFYIFGGSTDGTSTNATNKIYSAPIYDGSPDVSANPSWITDSNYSSGGSGSGTSSQTTNDNYELAYAEFNSNVSITSTVMANANTVVTAPTITSDGNTPVVLTLYSPLIRESTAGTNVVSTLWDGSTQVTGTIGQFDSPLASTGVGQTYSYRFTPSAGSHTYIWKAYIIGGGTGTIYGGIINPGSINPGYIRITLANPLLQGGAGIQNGTTLQTGNFNLQSSSQNNPTGILKGATSQSADIFEVQDASSNNLFTVSPTGNVTVSGNLSVGGTIGFSNTGNESQGLTINENITGSVAAGDVVVIDTANAGYVKDSSSANSTQVVGIATKTQTGGSEPIVISGIYQVNVTGTVAIGDYLVTSSTSGQAQSSSSPTGGVVGQAMGPAVSGKAWARIAPASGAGGGSSGGSSVVGVQTITSGSGTFTVPSNVSSLQVELVGGGGSGDDRSAGNGGGGGGGGGYVRKFIASPNSAYLYSVGAGGPGGGSASAGGNTTFGSLVAGGGATNGTSGTGAAGGTATGGDVNIPGGHGTDVEDNDPNSINQGMGGGTVLGAGGYRQSPGGNYGGGGGGSTGAGNNNGAGAGGVIIITEYGTSLSGVGAGGGSATELSYKQLTSPVSITSTSPQTVITADQVYTDGNTPLNIQFYAPSYLEASGQTINFGLYDGSTQIGQTWITQSNNSSYMDIPVNIFRELAGSSLPSAGWHTYTIKAWNNNSPLTQTIQAGDGVGSDWMPGYIRITLANPSLQGGTGSGIQNGTTLQTNANFNIQSADANSVTAIVHGTTSQSADIFDVQNVNNINLLSVDPNGNVFVGGDLNVGGTIGFSNIGNANQGITLNMVVTSSVNAGDVVVIDTNNPGQVTTTTLASSTKVFGVATETQSAGVSQPIITSGIYQVNVDTAAVNIGDYLVTSGTAGLATDSTSPSGGVVGQALSAKASGSNGTVWARINPGNGSGGSGSGSSNYGLMESDFTNSNGAIIPANLTEASTATIGNYVYIFGGFNGGSAVNTIYKASTSNPTSWSSAGTISPASAGIAGAQIAIIGSNIYLFGGYYGAGSGNTNGNIYSAPVSDPTSWSSAGSLPGGLSYSSLAIIGSKVYLFGGYTGTANTTTIYSASIGNLSSWTTTTSAAPNVRSSQVAVIGNYVYLFGGFNGSTAINTIYRASVSNPLSWTTLSGVLPGNAANSRLAIVGNYIYIFGGSNGSAWTGVIYKAPINNPVNGWANTGSVLPGALANSAVDIVGNALYLFGGFNGSASTNVIYSSPIYNGSPDVSSNPSWITDSNAGSGGSGTSSQTSIESYEIDYQPITASIVGISATNESGANTVITGNSKTYDGNSRVQIQFFAPAVGATSNTNGGNSVHFVFYRDSTPIGQAFTGEYNTASVSPHYDPVNLETFDTPSAGAHTYSVKAYVDISANAGTVYAGNGTTGQYVPAYLRVVFANPQLQGGAGIQNGTTVQTGNFNIQSSSANNPTAVIQGATSQSADILEVKDASNINLLAVDASGNLSVKGNIGFSNSGNANQVLTVNEPVTTTVNQYDVVVIDTNNAGQVTTTTLANSTKVFGVATKTSGTAGATQPIAISGIYQVNVDTAAVNVGDYLVTSGTAGLATDSQSPSGGVIGQAMSAKTAGSNGTVWVRINPGNGTGGSGSSANYGLMENSWINTGATLPGSAGIYGASIATIGNTIYSFGGVNASGTTTTIYSAPVSSPTLWTAVGNLPAALSSSNLAIIGTNIYLFGGFTSGVTPTTAIYRASVSTPTSWSSVGSLPSAIGSATLAVVGSNIYLYGGWNGSSYLNTIYTASIGNPLSWSSAGSLPGSTGGRNQSIAVVGNYIYIYGGEISPGAASSEILRAPVSSPTSFTGLSSTLPTTLEGSSLAIIGNYIYLMGGCTSSSCGSSGTSALYRASISNPTSWSNLGNFLPASLSSKQIYIAGNAVYLMGGYNGSASGSIYSAPIYNGSPDVSSNPSWITDSNASSGGGSGTSSQTANNNYELGYGQITTPVSVTATSAATANTIATATSITTDGNTPVMINTHSYTDMPSGGTIWFELYDGSTDLGVLGAVRYSSANEYSGPQDYSSRITPSAGSHTYSIKAYVSGSGITVYGNGSYEPAYIRITLANPSIQGGSAGIQNSTVIQTGNINLQSSSQNNPTLIISGTTSQSADILDVKNSAGSILFNVTPSGTVGIGTNTPQAALDVNNTIRVSAGGNSYIKMYGGSDGGSSSSIYLYNPAGGLGTQITDGTYTSTIGGALTVNGNLTVNGTLLLGASTTDPACTSGSLYYNTSSDAFKGCAGSGSGASWQKLNGVLAYGTNTGSVSSTGTTYSTGTDILSSPLSFTADGTSDYIVTISAAWWEQNTTNDYGQIAAMLDGSFNKIIATDRFAGVNQATPLNARGFLIAPSAGTHTINGRLFTSSDGGTITIGVASSTPILMTVEKL